MLSRSKSQVFSRKGSIERSRESKFGAREFLVVLGSWCRAARLGGNCRSVFGGCEGSW